LKRGRKSEWGEDVHIMGYQEDEKEEAIIVAAYTPPVFGKV
jgi:hypothetical protein